MENPNPATVGAHQSLIADLAASRGKPILPANIVVVGGGLAGLCATIEAARKGSTVTLMEKNKGVGGNSAKATSGINGLNTFAHAAKGIKDTLARFKADTLRSGGGLSDETLVDALVSYSTDTVNWLHEDFGLDLSDLTQLGGHSAPRTHRLPPQNGRPVPVGWTTVSALKAVVDKLPNVTVLTNSTLVRLLTEDDDGDISVVGLEYEKDGAKTEMRCDAVILATGGFAFDRSEGSLLREFAPQKLDLPTTSGPQADGSAIRIARRDVNALLVHMDHVQVHPTGLVDPKDPLALSKMLAPEAMRGCGGIMLSPAGRRFCDELSTRDYVTARIQAAAAAAAPGKPAVAYLVMNEEATTSFGAAALDFYEGRGMVRRCAGTGALAELIGCGADAVEGALAEYARVADGSANDPNGRTVCAAKDWRAEQTFTVAVVTPSIHYTMGGIAINASGEVLAQPPKPKDSANLSGIASTPIVLGLYAAGECAGGLHGANRLAGNSLLECAVFGRIAGQRAAAITTAAVPALDPEQYLPLRLRCRRTLSARGHLHEFTLELPSTRHRLAPFFKPGQYISMRHKYEADGKTLLEKPLDRFYSPVSRDGMRGEITLLIKAEPDRGAVQDHLCNIQPGDALELRGPCGGLSFDLFDPSVERIGLICGGSGVSPMVQIIRECLFARAPKSLRLVWGAEYSEDLVYRKVMDEQARLHPDMLAVTYVINRPDFGWFGETGMVDAAVLRRYMFRPGPGTKIVICGPYIMCKIMKETLKGLGYSDDMVYSFM
eukprot:TRINITY_DN613_c0_g1_i3.p1 TRINITY_DN613_c0_g1~~TRINITY_DN613_c0_g1_i3.p1  ORF type:complete len:775 (-),score=321.81 TRINITY_DN613_c0_g1_i3:557-2881(-)